MSTISYDLTPEVEAIGKLDFSGTTIPDTWYKTIVRENGKPNLTAIVILSDIVYCYQHTNDHNYLLKKTYQQFSDQFGFSKRDATNAIIFLEKMGLIKREFKTIDYDGIILNNFLHIRIYPDAIKNVTFLSDCGE